MCLSRRRSFAPALTPINSALQKTSVSRTAVVSVMCWSYSSESCAFPWSSLSGFCQSGSLRACPLAAGHVPVPEQLFRCLSWRRPSLHRSCAWSRDAAGARAFPSSACRRGVGPCPLHPNTARPSSAQGLPLRTARPLTALQRQVSKPMQCPTLLRGTGRAPHT